MTLGATPARAWLVVLVGTVSVAAAAVLLTSGAVGAARRDTVVFAVIAVAGAFLLPNPQRTVLAAVAVAGWVLTIWSLDLREVAPLIAQLGGSILVTFAALETTRARERAIAVEGEAAAAAETRTSLLGTVLRLQSLEPEQVLVAVANGAYEAGFVSASVSVPGADDQLALVVASPADAEPPPVEVGDDGVASVALRAGRPVVAGDRSGRHDRDVPGTWPGPVIAAPLVVDGEAVAVLAARAGGDGISEAARDAFDLLVTEGGLALGRARRFAADAATVEELRRLEVMTHDFVSTVSHELRTPMTVIAGLSDTLQRRWDDLPSDHRLDLMKRVDGNAERLAVMVRSLMDTSALERGRLVAVARPVAVRPLVDEVAGRLAPVLEAHHLEIDVPPDLVVAADRGLLSHVLENLLANAAGHTPAGTAVAVRARTVGTEVEIAVVDDGPGIAAPDLPHVVERFYRAGALETRPTGGLGLGLALTRQILQAHGRDLTLHSPAGKGAVFSFRLPVAAPEDRT